MKAWQLSVLFLLAASSLAWAEESKAHLEKARSDYRQAVTEHGPRSPEAKNAKRTLRTTRHTFYAQRREQMQRRALSR